VFGDMFSVVARSPSVGSELLAQHWNSYAAWLYYGFNLSHLDTKGLLAELGITGWRASKFH
jgi:hypothetical protein